MNRFLFTSCYWRIWSLQCKDFPKYCLSSQTTFLDMPECGESLHSYNCKSLLLDSTGIAYDSPLNITNISYFSEDPFVFNVTLTSTTWNAHSQIACSVNVNERSCNSISFTLHFYNLSTWKLAQVHQKLQFFTIMK